LSTTLNDKLVGDGFRQAILGHQNGTIVNRHYTAQKAALLKDCLDMADFGMEITLSHAHGFPVITGCSLGGAEIYVAEMMLDDAGKAEKITIFARGSSVPCFESRVLGGQPVSASPDAPTVPALPPGAIRRRINQIVGKGQLRVPTVARKRELVEHFRALA
jgi:hypothetical protein